MKFEHLINFIIHKIQYTFMFQYEYVKKIITKSFLFLFSWKANGYADSYWFLYSNKKFYYQLRYINLSK